MGDCGLSEEFSPDGDASGRGRLFDDCPMKVVSDQAVAVSSSLFYPKRCSQVLYWEVRFETIARLSFTTNFYHI